MYTSVTSMFLYTLLSLLLGVLIYLCKERARYKRMINVFPGRDDGHFLFGDIWRFSLKSDEIFQEFRQYNKLFPKGYRLWSMWHGVIAINTAEHAEVILSSTRHITKSLVYRNLHPWLKTGLLTSKGEKWFQRRRLLTPAFHFNILKKLTEDFNVHQAYLLELLAEESKNAKTNVVPLISNVALNIICGTSMGVSLNNNKRSNEYRQAIYGVSSVIKERTIKPWLMLDFVFRLDPLYKVQQKLLNTLHSFTSDIISKREEEFDENEFDDTEETYLKKKQAMLDLLLTAKRKRGEIDDEGIREEVDTFTFEGHDTVSMGISFALLLIANHKDHQERIIKELDSIFGDSNRSISYQDLQNMHYLELCLKECLRLYPSVPFISRMAEDDIPLGGKYIIPNGAVVHIHIFDVHRNPKYFPNPEKFDPDRFLPENVKNRHPYAYIPFSAGPRNCIGQKYAMLEMKSIIATILRIYELEPIDTPQTITLSMELVLRTTEGINMKFVPRTK